MGLQLIRCGAPAANAVPVPRSAFGLAAALALFGAVPAASGQAFFFAPPAAVGDIISARFFGNFAGLTAHRYFGETQVNRIILEDPDRTLPAANLSQAFFGNAAFNNPTPISLANHQTGLFNAVIPAAFYPVLMKGKVDLIGVITDTVDAAFAIDTLYLEINTTSRGVFRSFYGSGLDGFLLTPPVAIGANLPGNADVFNVLPAGRTGTGFDETVSSKAMDVPAPAGALVLGGLAALFGARRRTRPAPERRGGDTPERGPGIVTIVAAAATVSALVASSHAQTPAPAPDPDDFAAEMQPPLDPDAYAGGQLVWTFGGVTSQDDIDDIIAYLEDDTSGGAGVQVFNKWFFPEISGLVVHTSTPGCREVSQCLSPQGESTPVNPGIGFATLPAEGVCPQVFPAPPAIQTFLEAVEPNVLDEPRQAATVGSGREKIPDDPAFPSQWSLNNRGRIDGYVYADLEAVPNGQFDATDAMYIDVNKDGKKDNGDQHIAGTGNPANGTALRAFSNNEYGLAFCKDPVTGAGHLTIYRDAGTTAGVVDAGDVRVIGRCGLPSGAVAATDPDAVAGYLLPAGRRLSQLGTIDADVDAPQAWVHQTDCGNTIVGVIDSGIDVGNPDLAANLWVNGAPTVDDVNGAAFIAQECHAETGAINGAYDNGELIYVDVDGSQTVTEHDQRLSNGGGGLPVGPVMAGDADINRRLGTFKNFYYVERFVDLGGGAANGVYDRGEPLYADLSLPPLFQLTGAKALRTGGPAQANGTNTLPFPASYMHRDNVTANGAFEAGEFIYIDNNGNSIIDANDTRITRVPNPAGGFYGNNVAAGDADAIALPVTNRDLVPFLHAGPELHAENVNANGRFDDTEYIIIDYDSNRRISLNDYRITATNGGAAGTFVVQIPNPAGGMMNPADFNTPLINFRIEIMTGAVRDVGGHGTAVASVIGAVGNNTRAMAGVCWRTRLMGLRVSDIKGRQTNTSFIAAVNYASAIATVDQPVVLNYSAGAVRGPQAAERAALRAAHARRVLFVCAADNRDGRDLTNEAASPNDHPTCYSADGTTPNVVGVGCSNNRDLRRFSFGTGHVNVGAPGERIPMLQNRGGGALVIQDGCSFASPHVAGMMAHAIGLFPDLYKAGAAGHITIKNLVLNNLTVDSRFGVNNSYVVGLNNAGRARIPQGADFGDAPDPTYPTLAANSGARHKDINEEWLGKAAAAPGDPNGIPAAWFQPPVGVGQPRQSDVTPEFDAENRLAPAAPAANRIPADPDGVPNLIELDASDDALRFMTPLIFSPAAGPANEGVVRIFIDTQNSLDPAANPVARLVDANGGRYPEANNTQVNPLPGVAAAPPPVAVVPDDKFLWVNLWLDWNRNGTWDDAGERVLCLRANPTTWIPRRGALYTVKFPMPQMPVGATPGLTRARVRLDYGENAGTPLVAAANMRATTDPAVGFAGTAPGGMVRLYSDAGGGLPNAGAYSHNRWEAPPTEAAGGVLRVRNQAMFGEVEDYRVFTYTSMPNADQLHITGPATCDGQGANQTITAYVQRDFAGLAGHVVRFHSPDANVLFTGFDGDGIGTTNSYGLTSVNILCVGGNGPTLIEVSTGSLTAYHVITVANAGSTSCLADFNEDGSVTVGDLFAFLAAWFDAEQSADTNGDSVIGSGDLFKFLAAWFAGCPS